jgi:hypothetical protein
MSSLFRKSSKLIFKSKRYSSSNNLIIFNNNKLNNLNSSLWNTLGNNIYSNLGRDKWGLLIDDFLYNDKDMTNN